MEVLAYIGARGGSKGLPGKNIKLLAGKPLIAWTIQAALNSKSVNRLIFSSDDQDILRVARKYGAETVVRPKWMAADHVSQEPGIRHAVKTLHKKDNYRPDFVIVLQPTSPLRTAKDIDNAVKIMIKQKAKAVFSVYEMENSKVLKSLIEQKNGELIPTISYDHPFMSRWLLPKVYHFTGAIHIIDRRDFENGHYLAKSKILPYVMTRERSEDIDKIENFRRVEKILRKKFK